jgi:hypothetical protein
MKKLLMVVAILSVMATATQALQFTNDTNNLVQFHVVNTGEKLGLDFLVKAKESVGENSANIKVYKKVYQLFRDEYVTKAQAKAKETQSPQTLRISINSPELKECKPDVVITEHTNIQEFMQNLIITVAEKGDRLNCLIENGK